MCKRIIQTQSCFTRCTRRRIYSTCTRNKDSDRSSETATRWYEESEWTNILNWVPWATLTRLDQERPGCLLLQWLALPSGPPASGLGRQAGRPGRQPRADCKMDLRAGGLSCKLAKWQEGVYRLKPDRPEVIKNQSRQANFPKFYFLRTMENCVRCQNNIRSGNRRVWTSVHREEERSRKLPLVFLFVLLA